MHDHRPTRGVDHIGITVPDLEAASRFLVEAFNAVPMYDNITHGQPPQAGAKAEGMLLLAPGTRLVAMRMLQLANGPGIELFEMHGPDQHAAARPSDCGLQHFAIYVDKMDAALERFKLAGGTLAAGPSEMLGLEKGEGNSFCYGRTPWGTVVEFLTYPSPEIYEEQTELRRWTPAVLIDQQRSDNVAATRTSDGLSGCQHQEIGDVKARLTSKSGRSPETKQESKDGLHGRENTPESSSGNNKAFSDFPDSQHDGVARPEAEMLNEQARRLEMLGSIASGIAHEFNNLMTIVVGSISQLEKAIDVGSREHQRLEHAKWAVQQAERLTQQILGFTRKRPHEVQCVDLNQIVQDFEGIVRQLLVGGVELRLELCQRPLPVQLDAEETKMALLNLVRNASDAMPTGGVLVIRTSVGADTDAGAAMTELVVADTGAGMTAEAIRHATEPFFTTKPKGSGTGLGLPTVRGFVTAARGNMRIQSEIGRGTEICLRFPRSGILISR